MPKVKKRTDARYQKCFRYEGHRYTVYGDTPTAAEQAKAKKISELEAGIIDRENPTLNSYYETFTENRRHSVKQATLRGQFNMYKSISEIVIYNNVKFGEMRIRDIKPKDIQAVQNVLIASGNNSRTVNDKLAHLKHVFHEAIKDETIDKSPCNSINNLKRTETPIRETKHRAISPEEIKLFLDEAKDSYFINLFKLMICTGLRIGEVGAISRADIGATAIHISKTITRNEYGGYFIGNTPKTDSSIRDIPLNSTITQIIKEQNKLNADIFGISLDLSKPIFRNPDGGLLREYAVNREIKRITNRCGIEYFSSHALRNTFATDFYIQLGDIKTLQSLMGHSDIRMTMNVYTHTPNERKAEAMKNFKAI